MLSLRKTSLSLMALSLSAGLAMALPNSDAAVDVMVRANVLGTAFLDFIDDKKIVTFADISKSSNDLELTKEINFKTYSNTHFTMSCSANGGFSIFRGGNTSSSNTDEIIAYELKLNNGVISSEGGSEGKEQEFEPGSKDNRLVISLDKDRARNAGPGDFSGSFTLTLKSAQ